MSIQSRVFARLINPGVVLSQELGMQIYNYEKLYREQTDLDNEINRMRSQQNTLEDNLAEAMAEEEFQRCLKGCTADSPTEEQQLAAFKQHLSRVINSIAVKMERKLYLDVDMRKLKQSIEKGIATANELFANAEAAES